MIKISFLIFFAGFSLMLFSQQDSIVVKAEKIFTNINGNIFLVNGASLSEINRYGLQLSNYTLEPPEEIDYCDVSNPLEIILYNRSSNRVCVLDDKLSVISDSKPAFDGRDVSVLCSSSYGGVWFFDNNARQMIHKEKTGIVKMFSQPFFSFSGYKSDLPYLTAETRDFLYCAFPESGVMVFDRNATYIKTIENTGYFVTGFFENKIISTGNNIVKIIDVSTGKNVYFNFTFIVKQAFISNDELVLFTGEKIFFKKLNKN